MRDVGKGHVGERMSEQAMSAEEISEQAMSARECHNKIS